MKTRTIECASSVILLASFLWVHDRAGSQDGKANLGAEIVRSSGVNAGLCVCLGVRDGNLCLELAGQGNFVVNGLALNADAVDKSRRQVVSQEVYGRVSIEKGALARLPHADNLVNLVVVDDIAGLSTQGLSMTEVLRVLRPRGVAYVGQASGELTEQALKAYLSKAGIDSFEIVKRSGIWAKVSKPENARTDSWEQWMHGPGRNLVSSDAVVGPGRRVQWIEGPMWGGGQGPSQPRHIGLVSAQGRLIYGERDWSKTSGLETSWYLIARDAYNGFLLWRRPVGASFAAETLAAVDSRVYTVVDGKLSSLNAATGETVLVYDKVPQPSLIAVCDGKLVVLGAKGKGLAALDARSGRLDWTYDCDLVPAVRWPLPEGTPFVAGDRKVFCKNAGSFLAVELASGKVLWQLRADKLPNPEGKHGAQIRHHAHGLLLVVNPEGDKSCIHALSASDGKHLWTHEFTVPMSRIHVLSYPEEIWVVSMTKARTWHPALVLDPRDGKEKRRVSMGLVRCSAPRGCSQFMLTGNSTFFDLNAAKYFGGMGLRSSCTEGEIPANGLNYFLPISCICAGSIRGVLAIAPGGDPRAKDEHPLERGSARPAQPQADEAGGWPAYRFGPQRGNVTPTHIPPELTQRWEAKVSPGRGSPLSAACGLVFVCDVDGFQVCALDAASGKTRWRYSVGSRVDVPPTHYQGLCLFGARDGWVYCLDARSGGLHWRYRAAPDERRIMVLGRLESAWPVASGVLVQNGIAYFSAGRVHATDGGLYVHAVELSTGTPLWVKKPQCTADLLVSDGTALFMNGTSFDLKDGTIDPRKLLKYPRGILGVSPGVADDPPRFDTRVTLEQLLWSHELDKLQHITNGCALTDGSGTYGSVLAFTDKDTHAVGLGYQVIGRKAGYALMLGAKGTHTWSMKLPLRVTALVRAGDKLVCAGTPLDRSAAKKAELWVLAAADGKTLQTIPLPARPCADGLIVAYGKVFVATEDGRVLCFGKNE